jgi:molecular chaperone GrpE
MTNDEVNEDEINGLEPEQMSKEPFKRQPVPVTLTDIELEQLKNEAAEYKDKYLRMLAESENARKRLQKEKQEMIQFSTQNLIAEFLNPMDHLEGALKFTKDLSIEVKHWATGFQMILTQFKDVLSNNSVTPIESVGKKFDPNCHEAVETFETDQFPPGIIIEEFIKGYKMGDRIVRPARVKVAKEPKKNKQNEECE